MADHVNISLNNLSDYSLPEDLVWLQLQKHFPKTTFDLGTQVALAVAFSVLILFGATGNGLVCYVVARNPQMRTPRNIFIINLAISDLTLCVFTQPFNLMQLSLHMWPMGNFMCKFVPMFAGTNVFVSTISITAIALDRFQVIVYPTKDSVKKVGAAVALVSIWIISLLMASPLLIFSKVKALELPGFGVFYHNCIEREDLHLERGAYSIASMVFQYIVPIVIVSVAHARICRKLKYRMVNQHPPAAAGVSSPFQKRRQIREIKRKRKTNLLLVMIAVVFSMSWMPLNVCNIIADFEPQLLQFEDDQTGQLIFAICHMLVLSSACTNPVLYGWLNENFRREFIKVLCKKCPGSERTPSCCGRAVGQTAPSSSVVLYANRQTNGTTHMELLRQTEIRTAETLDGRTAAASNDIEAV